MKLLLIKARSISVFILAISLLGCGDDDENKLPEVVSGFTQTIDEDTGTTTFINISTKADKYLWDFGDEETSTEINPVKSYAASGDYTVTLTATNLAGASDVSEAVLTIVVKDQMALPVTFDDALVIYEATVFEGASFDIVDNPAVTGSNDKETKVGALTNTGAVFEGLFFDLGADVDLESKKSITMNFWSDAAIDILIKLEKGAGADTEAMASHTGTGWELITFDFESGDSFPRLTLFVDGAGTTAGTYYLDDMIQTETIDTTPPVITLVGDAEITLLLDNTYNELGATALDDFDGEILFDQFVVGGDDVDTSTEGVYIITYNVSDAAGNAADTVRRTVNVTVDTMKPVITLNGDAETAIALDSPYTELGATAQDDFDGDISDQIVVSGDVVDTSVEGVYMVTYDVSDAAGNAADQLTRTVTVTVDDLVKPVITLVGASTINLNTGDPFTDPGATATDNTDGDISASIVVGGDMVDINTAATYTITYNVSDAAGNTADEVTRTVIVSGGSGGGGTLPPNAAPTPPARDAADVISLFSDAYTDIMVEKWSADWDNSSEVDVQVAGNTTKKISFGGTISGFLGVEFLNDRIDATDFTHFHIDIFTNTETLDKSFNLKFSDWAGGSTEVSAIEFSAYNGSSPALPNPNPGTWISLDIPLSSWPSAVGGVSRADLAQFVITSDLGEVYVDNIYLYK